MVFCRSRQGEPSARRTAVSNAGTGMEPWIDPIRRRAARRSTHYYDLTDVRHPSRTAILDYSCVRYVRFLVGLYRLADTVFAGTWKVPSTSRMSSSLSRWTSMMVRGG